MRGNFVFQDLLRGVIIRNPFKTVETFGRAVGRREGECTCAHSFPTRVPPLLPVDAPGASATSGQRKPFGAVTSIRSHDYHGNERAHATGGGVPDAGLLLPAGRVHPVCMAQVRCSWHGRRLTQIGRQSRSERESRVSSAGRAVTIRMRKGWMAMLAHTAGSYRCASRARLRLHGAVSFAS